MRINVLMINTEIWALALRLTYEYGFYDKFLVTEARTTFSGQRKPLYTKLYNNLIHDPDKKIDYIYLDALPSEPTREYLSRDGIRVRGNRWPAEVATRNAATQALISLVEGPRDTIVVQDMDEIANLVAVERAEAELDLFGLHHLAYVDYRGSVARSHRRTDIWTGGYAMRSAMLGHDLHDLRRVGRRKDGSLEYWHVVGPQICSNLDGTPMYPLWKLPRYFSYDRHAAHDDAPKGWHLTNMTGGFRDLFANKIGSYAHTENDAAARLGVQPPDETGDLWQAASAYMGSADYRGFEADPELPAWLSTRLHDYPILKLPA